MSPPDPMNQQYIINELPHHLQLQKQKLKVWSIIITKKQTDRIYRISHSVSHDCCTCRFLEFKDLLELNGKTVCELPSVGSISVSPYHIASILYSFSSLFFGARASMILFCWKTEICDDEMTQIHGLYKTWNENS